jgi:two-component system cell cycle response regulator CpdR
MRNFLVMALEKAGHETIACQDGQQALDELHSKGKFDLLLADIVMPGMDGIELSQKANELFPEIKVMFITGFAAVALKQKQAQETKNKVLSKPFHLKELVGQIDQLLAA